MSGRFRSGRVLASRLHLKLTMAHGLSRLFRSQTRRYLFTSIDDYDMTQKKYRTEGDDMLGCYMEPEKFKKWHEDVCKRLGISAELDNRLSDQIKESVSGKIEEIRDKNNPDWSPSEDIVANVTNIGGQDKDAPQKIIWPAEFSKPVASVGGLIANILWASTKREVERNLNFANSIANQIDEGEGQIASVLQYYPGRGPIIPFRAMNFLLKDKTGKAMTDEELKDFDAVKEIVTKYLDNIFPGASKHFKIDMEKQGISAVHVQSPHSSVVVGYNLKNGKKGYIGAEVGRPNYTYVAGKLVKNAHDQIVDPAVFQSMNRSRIPPQESIQEFEKIDKGVTKDNFYLQNSSIDYDQLTAGNKPIVKAISLVDTEKNGRAVYLSDGVPAASIIRKVPFAGRVARLLYFATGRLSWHGLRFGGYFAHHAETGQSRACEALVAFACRLAGINEEELLPVLSKVEKYDLSEELREPMYEAYLDLEINGSPENDLSMSIFSDTAASAGLRLLLNAFVTMQIYKDILETAERKINQARILKQRDEEAEAMRDLALNQTTYFRPRYSHMWALGSCIIINMYNSGKSKLFLDEAIQDAPIKETTKKAAPTSALLNFMEKFVEEKRDTLTVVPDGESQKSKSVRENSLDLANKTLDCFTNIRSDLGITD